MHDLKQRILDIIHRPQLAALATVTELNNPWVRYVIAIGDGDFVIRCATFADSRKVRQIKLKPDVHLTCGVNSLTEIKPYLQIQGRGPGLPLTRRSGTASGMTCWSPSSKAPMIRSIRSS